MDIARPRLGVGLYSNAWPAAQAFRELQAGLTHGHTGQPGRGVQQDRALADGSIIAVKHAQDPPAAAAACGWRATHWPRGCRWPNPTATRA